MFVHSFSSSFLPSIISPSPLCLTACNSLSLSTLRHQSSSSQCPLLHCTCFFFLLLMNLVCVVLPPLSSLLPLPCCSSPFHAFALCSSGLRTRLVTHRCILERSFFARFSLCLSTFLFFVFLLFLAFPPLVKLTSYAWSCA